MPSNVTVLIADAQRIPAVRAESPIEGPVLFFSNANLASALESIRAHDPRIVALESQFALTPEGRAFIERLRALPQSGSEIHLLGRANGNWSTARLAADPAPAPAATAAPAALNTRRAPRFPVVTPAPTVVDGSATDLIDISVLGAQVVSEPALRPRQRVKVTIVEQDAVLQIAARVAWSVFERLRASPRPCYRAGMEFDDAAQKALADFCRRHCLIEERASKA
jgi:hypothetical protein